jgi:hypothetical protein
MSCYHPHSTRGHSIFRHSPARPRVLPSAFCLLPCAIRLPNAPAPNEAKFPLANIRYPRAIFSWPNAKAPAPNEPTRSAPSKSRSAGCQGHREGGNRSDGRPEAWFVPVMLGTISRILFEMWGKVRGVIRQ